MADEYPRSKRLNGVVILLVYGVPEPSESGEEISDEQAAKMEDQITRVQEAVKIQRPEFEPRIVNGNLEAWLGQPVEDRLARDSAHCDYWCAHPVGLFFLLRGYEEDTIEGVEPGSILDITLPIWRVGEALLYASRIARSYADDPQISIHCHYRALNNRRLGALDRMRQFFMDESRVCHDAEAQLATIATAIEIDDNLTEILYPLLVPLYERFRFFELPLDLVRSEITRMRASRF